jgi:hypothetical protein
MRPVSKLGNGVWRGAQVIRVVAKIHFEADNADFAFVFLVRLLNIYVEDMQRKFF